MTPSARIQAAIEILEALEHTASPADRFIRNWFASRRYAGSKDRAAITERVYDAFRHRASYAWRMGNASPRALVLAGLLAETIAPAEIAALFSAGAYGPAPLTADETRALETAPREPGPPHVEGEYPEWLEPELTRAFGGDLVAEMRGFAGRAPVDLRVNTLRAARDDMLVGLRSLDFAAEPTPFSPRGIRIPSGERLSRLQQISFFQTGAIEVQEEAAQIAGLLCGARPGACVLDLAAGAGGKSLALAAEMQNKGEIVASDADASRLAQLGARARRAGATIIRTEAPLAEPAARFDIVLVDAPCSGSGSWRRNPENKWRLTRERLESLKALQAELLARAATHVRPGGRLVYATCSVLPSENEDQVEAFLSRKSGFRPAEAADAWRDAVGTPHPPGMDRFFRASPLRIGTDGFFVALLTRE
jgi:16S rRNA (cytosine967-C5)-methyltransferase